MKDGIKICLIFFLLYHTINIYSQNSTVFVDVANIREGCYLSSKVVGKLKQFNDVYILYDEEYCRDTIGGKAGLWMPIFYNNQKAYIWSNNLADGVLDVVNSNNDLIMIKLIDSVSVKLKVSRNDRLIHENSFTIKACDKVGILPIGKTYLSDSYILAVQVRNLDRWPPNYELFEWNGKEILKSDVQLVDDSKITGKYISYPYSLVNKDMAALRTKPDTNDNVAYRLPLNTKIKVLEPNVNNGTQWHKVEWNKQAYYIQYSDLSLTIRYIKSNKYKGISFLFTDNAIFAFENDSIIDKLQIPVWWGREEFYEIPTLRLNLGLDFLGVSVNCYTEGCDYGYDI